MTRRGARFAAVATVLLAVLACFGPAAFAAEEDASLRQRLDRDQAVAGEEKVLVRGHVDVGPKFVDGRWTLMVHDDTAKSASGGSSVWRHPERTALQVTDDALREVPDDPAYGFLRAEPGEQVYVVPQTQDPDVVWVGWNTQDPEVMERIDRGVRISLAGVQGPGSLVVYLQSGDFSEPDVLWDSAARAKPIWVDVNTHTHANWIFSEPGVYLVRLEVEADLIDGSTVADTRELRFSVGSKTPPSEAIAATWDGSAPEVRPAENAGVADASAEDGGGGSPALVVVIAIAAPALAAGLALALLRGNRAKRRARAGEGWR